MARNRMGFRLGDTIGATLVGIFLAVCLIGGFGSIAVNKSVASTFTVVNEEETGAQAFEPTSKVDEAQYADSDFVKAWAYDAEHTQNGWTKFKAAVVPLKDTTFELKEDGTGVMNFDGENDVDIFWRLTGENTAVMYDNEGKEFPMTLDGDVLTIDFPSKGMAFTEAEEEEE